jgi:signal transduction histidine kinase
VIRSLRARVILLVLVTSAVVAVVVVVAVQWFSSEQIAALLMEGVDTQAEADAMVDQYIGRVVALGALVGMVLGALSALWLVRRVLQPLEQFTRAIQMIASGDLSARVPDPPGAELHEVANAFNQMAATLERVEQLRAALVEDVAHELRTPLTSLRGYTEALADGIVEPDPDVLRTIHAEIERLTRLVQGLDELARWEASARERRSTWAMSCGGRSSSPRQSSHPARSRSGSTTEPICRGSAPSRTESARSSRTSSRMPPATRPTVARSWRGWRAMAAP